MSRNITVLSAGGKKLIRTVDGVTRVYDLIDRVGLMTDGKWKTHDVSPPPSKWDFRPHVGDSGERVRSYLCPPGTAQVVIGMAQKLS